MWPYTLSTVLDWYVEKKQEVLPGTWKHGKYFLPSVTVTGNKNLLCHQFVYNHSYHSTVEQTLRVHMVMK